MRFLARFNPLRAVRDLRMFLAGRQPHELYFMMAALVVTGIILVMFVHDSSFERPYKPDIVYVQQWRANRTDAEIRAQQKVDQARRDVEDAEQAKREAKLRAEFKKVDDALTRYGI